MGTRLYPKTSNPVSLEKLANVPAGTFARLEAINLRHKHEREDKSREELYDLEYKQWQEINNDPDLGNLEHFMLYGWGKFSHIEGISAGYAGHLDNFEHIHLLLKRNGIKHDDEFIHLCEGIHWS